MERYQILYLILLVVLITLNISNEIEQPKPEKETLENKIKRLQKDLDSSTVQNLTVNV